MEAYCIILNGNIKMNSAIMEVIEWMRGLDADIQADKLIEGICEEFQVVTPIDFMTDEEVKNYLREHGILNLEATRARFVKRFNLPPSPQRKP